MTKHVFSALLVALACAGVAAQQKPASPAAPPTAAGSQAPAQDPQPPRASPRSQQPPVTFKIEVSYVEVDAIVTDRQGSPVRDLTKDDFEILEDGKTQRVDLFAFVDIPIERAEAPVIGGTPVEPDVVTNARDFDGRLYVLLLDDVHTRAERTALVRAAARKFITENFGANDLAAVVHSSGRSDAGQEFTSNKRLLLDAVDKFMGRKMRSETLERLDDYNRKRTLNDRLAAGGAVDPLAQERAYNARSTLETLRDLAKYLTGVRGRRKALVFISEGIDYNIYDVFNNREATVVLDSVRDAIGAATRANVSIYGVDPRGLGGLATETMELSSLPMDPTMNIGPGSLQDEVQRGQDSLRTLADETGGFAVVNTNDFDGAFVRIVKDNSAYYVLGYYPTNERRDGKFRKIQVRVKRPGLEVRARKGYVAPRGKAEPEPAVETSAGTSQVLREALNSPLPQSGLTMAVQASAFKGTAPNASVLIAVQFDGAPFRFTEQEGVFKDTLELSMIAVDASGKIRGGDRNSVELKLRPQTREAVEAFGFRMLSRLDLPAGRYQLRVAGRTAHTGTVGSVNYDLVVPDFSKEPFSISGLALSSRFAGVTPSARNDDLLAQVLPGPPTTMRVFRSDDTIALFAEVYDNEVARPHKVDITTTLRAEDGRVAFTTNEERSNDELKGARGGYGYTASIPLADVAPGVYLLRVEAKSRLSGTEKGVERETVVRVVAPPAPQQTAPEAPSVPGVVSVVRGPRSGVEEYKEVVARTEEEWQAVWAMQPVRRTAPKVSFDSTMIVGVFLGSRPTSGYAVEIVGVARDGDTLVVQYRETKPASGVSTAQVVTSPYALAGVPMFPGPVRFDKVGDDTP